MNSKWEVREATIDDRDDVLSILPEGTYAGDYLPDKYTSLILEDPNYYGYVCISEGKIVGFSAVTVVDGGKTGVMRTGRMIKDLRGKGMLKVIGEYILKKHPYLIYAVHYTSTNMDVVLNKQRNKLITKVNYAFYQGNSTVRIDEINHSQKVSVVSEGVLQDLFSNTTRYPKVFKCKHLIVGTIPYMPINSNIQSILRAGNGFISLQSEPMKTLVTFGNHYRLPSGEIYCNLIVHGTINECFKEHITAHIRVFRKEVNQLFTIAIISLTTEENDLINDAIISLGLKRAPPEQYNREEAIVVQAQLQELANL